MQQQCRCCPRNSEPKGNRCMQLICTILCPCMRWRAYGKPNCRPVQTCGCCESPVKSCNTVKCCTKPIACGKPTKLNVCDPQKMHWRCNTDQTMIKCKCTENGTRTIQVRCPREVTTKRSFVCGSKISHCRRKSL